MASSATGRGQTDVVAAAPGTQVDEKTASFGEHEQTSSSQSWTSTLHDTITAENATLPLAWMSLLTGLVDGAVYAHFQVWVGFQTGNIVQFSMNIAEYIYPWSPHQYPLLTLMRALSFTSFFIASFVGARVGKKYGEKKRWYLILHSILQGIVLFAAAGILFSQPNGEEPTFRYGPPVIVLVAISMVSARGGRQCTFECSPIFVLQGLQSIQAQKLSSPVFSTSVAFTATLTQIASDPQLFKPSLYLLGDEKVKGRDLRILAIIALAIGGGIAQSLLDSSLGLSGSVAVCAGFKMFLSLLWLLPKGQPRQQEGGGKA